MTNTKKPTSSRPMTSPSEHHENARCCWLAPHDDDEAAVLALCDHIHDSLAEGGALRPARVVILALLDMASEAFASCTCAAHDSPDEFAVHQLALIRSFIHSSLTRTLEIKNGEQEAVTH